MKGMHRLWVFKCSFLRSRYASGYWFPIFFTSFPQTAIEMKGFIFFLRIADVGNDDRRKSHKKRRWEGNVSAFLGVLQNVTRYFGSDASRSRVVSCQRPNINQENLNKAFICRYKWNAKGKTAKTELIIIIASSFLRAVSDTSWWRQ